MIHIGSDMKTSKSDKVFFTVDTNGRPLCPQFKSKHRFAKSVVDMSWVVFGLLFATITIYLRDEVSENFEVISSVVVPMIFAVVFYLNHAVDSRIENNMFLTSIEEVGGQVTFGWALTYWLDFSMFNAEGNIPINARRILCTFGIFVILACVIPAYKKRNESSNPQ
jgi:hypothetical protein